MLKNITEGSYPYSQAVIPFKFDKTKYESYLSDLIRSGFIESNIRSAAEIFPHIRNLVEKSSENPNNIELNIGRYLIKKDFGKKTNIYMKNSKYRDDYNKGKKGYSSDELNRKDIEIPIDRISIYLFKTGIGFYCIQYNPKYYYVDDYIERNNLIKSLSHRGNCEEIITKSVLTHDIQFEDNMLSECGILIDDYRLKKSKVKVKSIINGVEIDSKNAKIISKHDKDYLTYETDYITRLPISDFIYEELSSIKEIEYFNEFSFNTVLKNDKIRESKKMASKAHCFNSLLIEGQNIQDEITENILMLSKGYKTSYKQDESNIGNYIFDSFTNSKWAVAREGIANFIWLTGDSQGDLFFKETYINRLDDYFYLYILSLHQYYSLIKASEEIASLPSNISDYVDSYSEDNNNQNIQGENYERLKYIINFVNYIYLKCIYHEVTHITHQAQFYTSLYKVLGIDTLVNEINYEVDRLTSIVSMIRQEEESKQDKRTQKNIRDKEELELKTQKLYERKMKLFTIIGAIFLILSTLNTNIDIINKLEINTLIRSIYKLTDISNNALTIMLSLVALIMSTLIGIVVYFTWINIIELDN